MHGNNNHPLAAAIFASVFAIVGAALMIGAIAGYRLQVRDAAVREGNPDSPWLWRKDWAQGRAVSNKSKTIYGWWIGATLLSMLFGPWVVTQLPSLLRDSNPTAFVFAGLALIPALVILGAVRATIRRQRFGKTYFEFASQPFSPGKRLSGQIHLRLDSDTKHGIDVRLSCIRRIVTGSGKSQTTTEQPLWQEKKSVPQNAIIFGPLGTSIPIEFQIPEEVYETNHEVSTDQITWALHAEADVPGLDYSDDFEVPVFRTAPRAARAAASALDSTSTFSPVFEASSTASDSFDVPAPEHPKVVVSITPEGATEFYFPAFRNRGRTLVLLFFTAIWTIVVYFLAHSRAPWFFPIVFGFFDLLLIYGCIQSVFGTARIVVGGGTLVSRKATFGAGTAREVAFGEIASIQATLGVQQGNSASNAWYSIRLRTKDGKSISLVDSIADDAEARWVVAQIEKLAGLKADTRVVLETLGGDLGPPPQRGSL